METRASYILVGVFVLTLAAAIVGIALWFGRVQFAAAPARYAILFSGDVSGLNIGSPVRYRGVPVGSVADIRIDPADVARIRVLVDLAADTPVKTDTVAQIALQGITGVAFIQLSGGTQQAPPLTAKRAGAPPVIRSRPSALQRVLRDLPKVFEKAVILVDRLTRMLDDRNIAAVGETLDNLRRLTGRLSDERSDLNLLVRDGRTALAALQGVAEETRRLAADLDARAGPLADKAGDVLTDTQVTLADIREAAATLKEAAEEARGLIGENRQSLNDFAQGGLYELSQFIAEARVLVDSLTRLTNQIERDPARFFFGDTQKGFQAQ